MQEISKIHAHKKISKYSIDAFLPGPSHETWISCLPLHHPRLMWNPGYNFPLYDLWIPTFICQLITNDRAN